MIAHASRMATTVLCSGAIAAFTAFTALAALAAI
jgi:hypothetical protein